MICMPAVGGPCALVTDSCQEVSRARTHLQDALERRRGATYCLGLVCIKMHVGRYVHVSERTSLGVVLGSTQNCHLQGKTGFSKEVGDGQLSSWGLTAPFKGVTAQI